MEQYEPLPPCSDYADSAYFWTLAQGILQKALDDGLIHVVTSDNTEIPYKMGFYSDGRIEVIVGIK